MAPLFREPLTWTRRDRRCGYTACFVCLKEEGDGVVHFFLDTFPSAQHDIDPQSRMENDNRTVRNTRCCMWLVRIVCVWMLPSPCTPFTSKAHIPAERLSPPLPYLPLVPCSSRPTRTQERSWRAGGDVSEHNGPEFPRLHGERKVFIFPFMKCFHNGQTPCRMCALKSFLAMLFSRGLRVLRERMVLHLVVSRLQTKLTVPVCARVCVALSRASSEICFGWFR